jgi:hypothetical protein
VQNADDGRCRPASRRVGCTAGADIPKTAKTGVCVDRKQGRNEAHTRRVCDVGLAGAVPRPHDPDRGVGFPRLRFHVCFGHMVQESAEGGLAESLVVAGEGNEAVPGIVDENRRHPDLQVRRNRNRVEEFT